MRALSITGLVLGVYLIGRAIVELFTIDPSNPASYRNDWGGPTLFGVLLVHVGPGLLTAIVVAALLLRRRSSARRRRPSSP